MKLSEIHKEETYESICLRNQLRCLRSVFWKRSVQGAGPLRPKENAYGTADATCLTVQLNKILSTAENAAGFPAIC